jgi:peptidoglycan/xylan/chitin deacetylase (PgdA/CDA1 family)
MKRSSLYMLAGVLLALTVGLGLPGRAAAATNLFASNAGVETWGAATPPDTPAPIGWSYGFWENPDVTITASGTKTTDHHGGSYSAKVTITKYPDKTTNPGDVGDVKFLPNPVPVTPGGYYTYSDYYRSSISSAVSVEYWTDQQLDGNGQPLGDGTWANLFSGIASSSYSWTQYTTGFTMPSNAVYATFAHFIYGVGWLEIDDVSMTQEANPPGFTAPMVSLTFDDGSAGFYTNAWPLVQGHGFKTTQYIPTGCPQGQQGLCGPGYDDFMMTLPQLSTLAQAGQEIGSHSVSHPYMSAITSPTTLDKELVDSKSFLEKNVTGAGTVTDFAYPFGDYDATVISHLQTAKYLSGRSVEPGYNTKTDVQNQPFDLRVQNILSTTTIADFQSWVDYAKTHNYWLVIVFHEVQPDNTPLCQDLPTDPDPCVGQFDTTVNTFTQMLNYLDSAGLAPTTVRDALATAQARAPQPGSVKIAPVDPTTNLMLTATPSGFTDPGKSFTYNYQWTVNGKPITGATSATVDLSKANQGDHGDKIAVRVTATDTSGTSSAVTDTVTVANTPPTSGTVSIGPPAPAAGTALTATPSGFADADGDTLTYQYAWSVNGQPVTGVTGNTLDANSVVGGTVTVQATADDGHGGTISAPPASVTVIGYPKAGTVSITPPVPTTNQMLTAGAVGFSDPQNEALTFSYQWLLAGTPIPGATSNALDLSKQGNGDHGDKISVKVTATNQHSLATSVVSSEVTVANTPPSGTVAITPTNPNPGTPLTATPTFADADVDGLAYQYAWYHDDQQIAGATGSTLPGNLVVGGTLRVDVTANDGHGGTSPVTSDWVTVNGYPKRGTASLTPLAPTTKETLTVDATGFSDPLTYEWLVNGKSINGETSSTLDLSKLGNGDRGDKISVQVTATNQHNLSTIVDSNEVTVANTPPSGTVAITPTNPNAGTPLTATPSFADADGDQLTYQYSWFENGQPIAVDAGNALPGSWVLAGTVTVQVTANDGHGGTSPVASVSVTVAPAPSAGGGTPAPGPGLVTDNSPLKIVVSNPSRPFYRLGTSLVLGYSCSAGSGVANCAATLGPVGGKSTQVASGMKVPLSKTGRYVLQVTGTDRSGKSATTTVYYRVTSDRKPPVIVIASPKGATYRLGQFLLVKFSCSDPSGVAGCSAKLGPAGGKASKVTSGSKVRLAKRGRYALRVSAGDGVGNAGTRTLYFSVR